MLDFQNDSNIVLIHAKHRLPTNNALYSEAEVGRDLRRLFNIRNNEWLVHDYIRND